MAETRVRFRMKRNSNQERRPEQRCSELTARVHERIARALTCELGVLHKHLRRATVSERALVLGAADDLRGVTGLQTRSRSQRCWGRTTDSFIKEAVKVPFGAKCLDAALCVPAAVRDTHTAVMLTHGAGGDMNFSQLVSLAHQLASHGFLCLRFTCKGLNLAYRLKAYTAVWDYLKSLQRFTVKRVFFGGRSMGCRAAAALARRLSEESEATVEGVICLSFPLHPPGQTRAHRQRSEDLRALPAHTRVLFVSGTEDDMCDRVYFDTAVKEMKAQVEILWLRGGSHGLKVKGRSEASVMEEVNLKVVSWIRNQAAQAP